MGVEFSSLCNLVTAAAPTVLILRRNTRRVYLHIQNALGTGVLYYQFDRSPVSPLLVPDGHILNAGVSMLHTNPDTCPTGDLYIYVATANIRVTITEGWRA